MHRSFIHKNLTPKQNITVKTCTSIIYAYQCSQEFVGQASYQVQSHHRYHFCQAIILLIYITKYFASQSLICFQQFFITAKRCHYVRQCKAIQCKAIYSVEQKGNTDPIKARYRPFEGYITNLFSSKPSFCIYCRSKSRINCFKCVCSVCYHG